MSACAGGKHRNPHSTLSCGTVNTPQNSPNVSTFIRPEGPPPPVSWVVVSWVVASFADQAAGEEATAAASCGRASDPHTAWEQVVARRKEVISEGALKLRYHPGSQRWVTAAYHVIAAVVQAAADRSEVARAAEVARLENWLARVVADRQLWMWHPYGGIAARRSDPVVVPTAWVNPWRPELVNRATTDTVLACWLAQLWDQQVTRWEAEAVGLGRWQRRQLERGQRRGQDQLLLRTMQVRHLDTNRIDVLRNAYDATARAVDPEHLLDPLTRRQRIVQMRAKLDAALGGADVTWAP